MSAQTATQSAHTNRLANATSPYLLQHAHNPVDWFPWGSEAMEKARREDKPIFLSIGYSACHWCHVMERESFENDEVAAILNAHFVSIKVDREERPDLDEIYMNATVIYNNGQGGWPMSVFLAADGKPFFAGTYFPPDSRYGRPGFKDLLQTIAKIWREDREKITQSAEALSQAVAEFSGPRPSDAVIPGDLVSKAADALTDAFDEQSGGLASGSNKFPPSMAMSLMLREYHRSQQSGRPKTRILDRVNLTLDKMANGGIYDHLGGGIARYSTDPEWLVPHFEKMLYDQALVSGIYLEAFELTRNPRWAEVAGDIFRYVLTDLQSPEGGFYSTRDADSEGVEGKFYVWSKQEVLSVLGEQVGTLFCSYYDVTDVGNWEGHNILNVQRDVATVARLHNISPGELKEILADARQKLYQAREQRVHPGLDDKILTAWNGLMISSLARGGRLTGDTTYTRAAAQAAEFILNRLSEKGRLLRTYRKGHAHTKGYLDDYAFFVEGLLDLYEASFELRWLDEAIRLNEEMIRHFWDQQGGGFFYTADDAEQLIVRLKDGRDSAIPSGNSVALMNLLRLSHMLDRADLHEKAEVLLTAFAGSVLASPLAFDRFLAGVDFHAAEVREIVVAGSPADAATQTLIRSISQVYDPYRVLMLSEPSSADAGEHQRRLPLLAGKDLVKRQPAVYICQNRTCQRPITSPDELLRELQSRR
ncbi:MAG: thioredoxin domain-containing protein [Phycisphaerae bacterium]